MDIELERCMTNYAAAHRARESIDTAAAARLVLMLKLEVPRMSIVLRLASKSHIWGIVGNYINDAIAVAQETHRRTQAQWMSAMNLEHYWRKAFLRAKDEIEVRIETDRENMRRLAPLYQMALEDATSSEGESIPELEFVETDGEDLVDPVDIIHDDEGMNRI
jgi:hypothetical protein